MYCWYPFVDQIGARLDASEMLGDSESAVPAGSPTATGGGFPARRRQALQHRMATKLFQSHKTVSRHLVEHFHEWPAILHELALRRSPWSTTSSPKRQPLVVVRHMTADRLAPPRHNR
jgi:hypothetical protein